MAILGDLISFNYSYPHSYPIFQGIFHEINHRAIGGALFLEAPHVTCRRAKSQMITEKPEESDEAVRLSGIPGPPEREAQVPHG